MEYLKGIMRKQKADAAKLPMPPLPPDLKAQLVRLLGLAQMIAILTPTPVDDTVIAALLAVLNDAAMFPELVKLLEKARKK